MNNINKEEDKVNECTSCQMCSAVCPTNAINIAFDEEGFYKPKISEALCIDCGECVKICYKYDNKIKVTSKNKEGIECYAAISKDNNILKSSTSGGISSHLMDSCLKNGYKVVGVSYDYDKDIAVTETTYVVTELDKFKGSKYMQSYTEKAFKEIVKNHKEHKYAVFGTPCHIYAISKWAVDRGRRDQFLLVDIFCHGCPSFHLWKKYSDNVKLKMKTSNFDRIDFRSKVHGWHEFCNSFYKKSNKYDSDKSINDPFFTIFFDNQILAKSCYDCKLRSTLEYTDIRMGDYWGAKYDLDTQGVSAIVICTSKGKEVFNGIKRSLIVEEADFYDIIKTQSYGTIYTYKFDVRDKTIELLKSDKFMDKIYKEYINLYPAKKRILHSLKKSIYIFPLAIINHIKKFYHRLAF